MNHIGYINGNNKKKTIGQIIMTERSSNGGELDFTKVETADAFPSWTKRDNIVRFFHDTMKPYEDKIQHIQEALDYAFSAEDGKGGFLMLAKIEGNLVGALLMLQTGMGGYIPENILLFVSITPEMRGKGVGRKLIEHCIGECNGNVKLHVEYDNPAKRLYERIGFTTNYAEMRFVK
ncbi:MAG: GNAT family N-acetyltransferase [Candidatus Electryoneaceae bacterium]|nr:GNAT family N-acetyltransferase [Candidatus Electryoneaceae bacterium]